MNIAIFDVDGTLLDNHDVEDECFAEALRGALGLQHLDTDWSQYRDVSDDGVAGEAYERAFGTSLPAPLRHAAIAQFVARLEHACTERRMKLVPGAGTVFATLEQTGWGVAVATGAWADAARLKLTSAGLPHANRPFATSEDGPARIDIIRAAISRAATHYGVRNFERVVSIGDGVWDVGAARTLDLPFVGVGTGARRDLLLRAGATTVLADFTDAAAVRLACERASRPLDALSI